MNNLKKYSIEFLVIFIGVFAAFFSENWRQELQDREDFELILEEIRANLRLDSIEYATDIEQIEVHLHAIDRLMDISVPAPEDSVFIYFDRFMYSFRWPDVKSTGIEQLRNSKNLMPESELIRSINNYYTWTEYLKSSTPYHYIMPQTAFNEWISAEKLDFKDDGVTERIEMDVEIRARLVNLKKSKSMQLGTYRYGLDKIENVLELFRLELF